MAGRLFVNRDNGTLIRVERVDDSYAYITVLVEQPMHWSMPRAEYEEFFVARYRLPTPEDLEPKQDDITLPKNAPPDWARNVLTDRVPVG